jgi:hypothetical protein
VLFSFETVGGTCCLHVQSSRSTVTVDALFTTARCENRKDKITAAMKTYKRLLLKHAGLATGVKEHLRKTMPSLCSYHDINTLVQEGRGTRWRSWLRHCATSRKVAGSIPDGITDIFH